MREKIARAPRWAVQLGTGVYFALFMTGFGLWDGSGLAAAASGGAVAGVLFGLSGGTLIHHQNRRMLQATGGQFPGREARRAAWRGAAPAGPEHCRQALALVDVQLGQYRWARPAAGGLAGLLAVLFLVSLPFSSPPAWLALGGAALFVALGEGTYQLLLHRRDVLTRFAGRVSTGRRPTPAHQSAVDSMAVLATIEGKIIVRVRRMRYVHRGEVLDHNGPLELSFADGTTVVLDAAADGESLAVDTLPWRDHFAEPLSAENRAFVATSGTWTAVDVSVDREFSRLVGRMVERVEAITDSAGTAVGALIHGPRAVVRAEVGADDLLVEVA